MIFGKKTKTRKDLEGITIHGRRAAEYNRDELIKILKERGLWAPAGASWEDLMWIYAREVTK